LDNIIFCEVYMKKTLVALAALAAFGSAYAQVTVYGKVDLGVSNTKVTKGLSDGWQVGSGNYEGSRFGVKASQDIGDGMKVLGQYEFGVNAADIGNIQNNRVATLGLTGAFGTVTAGLQWTPYDSAWGFDQMEYNGFSAANKTWYKGKHGDNGTTGNGNAKKSIAYTTSDMNGFNATFMAAGNERDAATTNWVPAYVGVGANYASGPLNVNFGYENVASSKHNSTAAVRDQTSAFILGASYNLGSATVGAGFQSAGAKVGASTFRDSGSTLSVSVPLSAKTTIALGIAGEKTKLGSATSSEVSSFGGQVVHKLTEQAAVYGGLYQTTEKAATAADVKTTKMATGLRYNF
jgi:predicted porin